MRSIIKFLLKLHFGKEVLNFLFYLFIYFLSKVVLHS